MGRPSELIACTVLVWLLRYCCARISSHMLLVLPVDSLSISVVPAFSSTQTRRGYLSPLYASRCLANSNSFCACLHSDNLFMSTYYLVGSRFDAADPRVSSLAEQVSDYRLLRTVWSASFERLCLGPWFRRLTRRPQSLCLLYKYMITVSLKIYRILVHLIETVCDIQSLL